MIQWTERDPKNLPPMTVECLFWFPDSTMSGGGYADVMPCAVKQSALDPLGTCQSAHHPRERRPMTTDYERAIRDAAAWLLDEYGESITSTTTNRMIRALLPPASSGAGGLKTRHQCRICGGDGKREYGKPCNGCGGLGWLGGHPSQYAHIGDPCQRCGTPHDDVAPGPCPSTTAEPRGGPTPGADRIRALEAVLSVSAVRFSQLAGELDRRGADAMSVLARVYQQQIADALEETRALADAQQGGADHA